MNKSEKSKNGKNVRRVSVLRVRRALCVCDWAGLTVRATHGLPICVGTGVPWVSLTGPTSVPSYAQTGWHRGQSANPLLLLLTVQILATIITRAVAITPPRSNTRVVGFRLTSGSTVSHRTHSICARAHAFTFDHAHWAIHKQQRLKVFVRNASHVAPSCASFSCPIHTFLSVQRKQRLRLTPNKIS